MPYSENIGYESYTLKFEVLSRYVVHMCHSEKGAHCREAPDNEDWDHWEQVGYEVIFFNKIVNIFESISLNIYFGCSKERSR